MKWTLGIIAAGLILLSAFLYLTPDLRGWTPPDFSDPSAIVQPTRAGKAAFAIADCVPGTIDPWNVPAARDGQQFESQSMLTCRSRSSTLRAVGIYLLAALTGLIIHHRRRKLSKAV